jgi:NADH-quinone oxidoreductase subunit L
MVTAGVYMVARSSALFALSETAMLIVLAIGTFTAIFAASMAMVQYDIKRVLAYSTVSQLGYMFMALGAGAFTAGIFHLMTHAFFKALLFLTAGSVMHAMHGELDFHKMGGLKSPMPKTYWRFLVGALAISGIVPFSGFFSKDAILLGALLSHPGGTLAWAIGTFTAFLTAYYTFRIFYRTFLVKPADPHNIEHAHEAPPVMIFPLTILAVLALIGGWVGIPGYDAIGHYLEPIFPKVEHHIAMNKELMLMGFALLVALLGIAVARQFHFKKTEVADRLATENPLVSKIHSLLFHKWYVDEIYDALFVRPIYFLSDRVLFKIVDVNLIDGIVNDVSTFLNRFGMLLRRIQTGDARTYAAAILAGTLGLILYFVWTVKG